MGDLFDAYGINLGPLYLRYYGIIIVLAVVIGSYIASRIAKRAGYDPEHVWGAMTWALIPAVIGARIWFILFPAKELTDRGINTGWILTHPFDLEHGPLAIWNGGLGVMGAIIGGAIGVLIYVRRNNIPVKLALDIGLIAAPLGQAIGRWGNFINQELYGIPTDLPWGITIPRIRRIPPYNNTIQYPLDTRFHPTFLYESIWNFAIFGFLYWLWRKRREWFKPGDFVLLYLILYPAGRFFLEFIRAEIAVIGPVNINQAIMFVLVIGAAAVMLFRHRPGASKAEAFYAPLSTVEPFEPPVEEGDVEESDDYYYEEVVEEDAVPEEEREDDEGTA